MVLQRSPNVGLDRGVAGLTVDVTLADCLAIQGASSFLASGVSLRVLSAECLLYPLL